jgi:hypothetical protein
VKFDQASLMGAKKVQPWQLSRVSLRLNDEATPTKEFAPSGALPANPGDERVSVKVEGYGYQ